MNTYGRIPIAFARGEGVWAELLQKQGPEAGDDPWVARAQGALWQRLGDRFSFRPEVDYPLVAAEPAERKRAEQEQPDPKSAAAHGDSNETRHRPRGEEQPR